MTDKTIRLIVPDWQAGVNPIYKMGAQILEAVAPKNNNQKTVQVPISEDDSLTKENGVAGQKAVLQNLENTKKAILSENPDRIITLGGNCLVSQMPIDYLNGYYDNFGVVWIDAHPDISTPKIFSNEHAMVVANLLYRGDPLLQETVNHPLKNSQIYYAGLSDPTIEEKELLDNAGINYHLQKGSSLDLNEVKKWIEKEKIEHVYLHLDVDVMNPDPRNFYPTYYNNPALKELPDNAAKGMVSYDSVVEFMSSFKENLVGVTLAEFMPWGAQAMQNLMNNIGIF